MRWLAGIEFELTQRMNPLSPGPHKRKEMKGFSFIPNRQRLGKKARNVRRGEVGIEPRTFGHQAKRFDQLR